MISRGGRIHRPIIPVAILIFAMHCHGKIDFSKANLVIGNYYGRQEGEITCKGPTVEISKNWLAIRDNCAFTFELCAYSSSKLLDDPQKELEITCDKSKAKAYFIAEGMTEIKNLAENSGQLDFPATVTLQLLGSNTFKAGSGPTGAIYELSR